MRAALACAIALLAAAPAAAQSVELRPIDRATVRIIAIGQVVPGPAGGPRFDFAASHGSGVVLDDDGWIATAAHVIDDAELLIVVPPGRENGMPARVAWRDPDHDLALVRIGGEAPGTLPPGRAARLTLGDPVSASGYPLDVRETSPAAVSGQIGRPLNDGRVQLSMSVNPGNSGGPVITARGALVGILSQGANPQAGAQGVAIMEPIGHVTEPLARVRAEAAEPPPARDPVVDVLLERLAGRQSLDLDARVTRLRDARPEGPIASAVFANEADAVAAAMLARSGVTQPGQLDAISRGTYDGVRASSDGWAQAVGGVPPPPAAVGGLGLRGPTPASPPLTAGSAAPSITGPATGPSPVAPPSTYEEEHPPFFAVGLTALAGLHTDDARNADPIHGGEGGLAAALRLYLAQYVYFRSAWVAGLELGSGAWRDRATFNLIGAVGFRLEVGPEEVAPFVELLYTPGFTLAEDRDHGTPLGYRASVGVALGDIEIGIAYREIRRAADDTLRTLLLTVALEVAP